MRKLIVQMMITVDGFVADTGRTLDWIDHDPQLGIAHYALAQGADALLMGHGVYREMAGYWPEVAKTESNETAIARLLNEAHKIILCTKQEDLAWNNAEQLLAADEAGLVDKVRQLKDQPGGYLVAYGGVQTAQMLVRHGLVDEFRLDVCPVALGEGERLFAERQQLHLVQATTYDSGTVSMTYRLPDAADERPRVAPVAEQAPAVPAAAGADEAIEFGSWAKILIVEDNPQIAELYKTRMEMIGYICFVAHEGNEALRVMEKERPSLVLLDLMVPGVAGDQILKRMRASDWGKDIKVLVISNLNEEDAPAGLRAQGIEGYAVKANLTDDQLDQMVNKIFERSGERRPAAG